jgi:YfiH family protein
MTEPKLQYYQLGDGVTAFSSTRHGGYSKGNYAEFNINHFCGDDEQAISQNRQALCRLLGIRNDCLLLPHQVHHAEILAVDELLLGLSPEEQHKRLDGIDALMTNEAGVCIGVSTADCIPVLLYDPIRRASCAIHAGWRGTVQRIAEKAVGRMTETYGTNPKDIIAQIGPGIHLESFEVGDEVYEAFEKAGFPMEQISKRYEKWHIDLPECNRLQLVAAGIPEAQIAVSPVCTFQQSDTFFSARRLSIHSGRIFTGILLQESESDT